MSKSISNADLADWLERERCALEVLYMLFRQRFSGVVTIAFNHGGIARIHKTKESLYNGSRERAERGT